MDGEQNTVLIVPAGGVGKRMGAPVPKQFLRLGGRTILAETIEAFAGVPDLGTLVLVCPEGYEDRCRDILAQETTWSGESVVIPGGAERQDSVARALDQLERENCPDDAVVLIHDAVRPYVTKEVTDRVIRAVRAVGAAIPAVPVTETIRHRTRGTIPREDLFRVQTPQGFRFGLLKEAFRAAEKDDFLGTDEAGLVERIGRLPVLVEGDPANIKITLPEDLEKKLRVGTGYDVHRLAAGRKLVLGGVTIPFEKGLLGHSDADVLVHAICDALFGAAADGDIGNHFPDTDPQYAGISSLVLLEKTAARLRDNGFVPVNIDATVLCQRPKLAPYIPAMREKIAEAAGLAAEDVSVKATTTEGLGYTGREEGIAAQAVCAVEAAPFAGGEPEADEQDEKD